jgi:SAM-dependent methyltransferase
VPYSAFRPEFTDVMDAANRTAFDGLLVDAWLPLAPGLTDELRRGIRVADVGCGTGHALVVLGKAFPASSFVGYDLARDAIERARAEAAAEGLENVRYEVLDAASLDVDEPFDAAFVFDAIHDQAQPATVLARIHAALRPGGAFFMVEPRASSNLEDNVEHPFAAWLYSVSTLHCMTVSLAEGGAGLGTVWGEQLACQMLADVGFVDVVVHEAPEDPLNSLYLSRAGGG